LRGVEGPRGAARASAGPVRHLRAGEPGGSRSRDFRRAAGYCGAAEREPLLHAMKTQAFLRARRCGRTAVPRWAVLALVAALWAAGPAAAQQTPAPNPADVRFMREMIGHHAQALEMTALVPGRAAREDLRMMAGRITVSQQDEIAIMRRWLESRGQAVPATDAHHGHHGGGEEHRMPGMATPEEMARLSASTGAEFDRLFLELMIRHHEGALVMVAQLFAAGGGQESQVFHIASEVDADQRMEIDRMRAMQQGPLAAR